MKTIPGSFRLFTGSLAALLLLGAAPAGPRVRSFHAVYVGTIDPLPQNAAKMDVWFPIPSSTDFQRIHDVKIEAPGSVTTAKDSAGNSVAHFRLQGSSLDQKKPVEVRVSFTAERSEALFSSGRSQESAESRRSFAAYLLPNRLVPTSPRVSQLAEKLSATSPDAISKARAFYQYLIENGTYEKTTPGWGRGDSERFCDVKRGNCTDFHSLFMALSRAEKIPVRFKIGFPLKPEKEGTIPGYHCWAEFHADSKGWIPVDASDAAKSTDVTRRAYLFGNLDPDRVEFSTGRDLTLAPPQHDGPVNFLIYPYVEVDGKAFAETKIRLEYKDV